MNRLRPGEKKILNALSKDDKRFSDLQRDTSLQANALSGYLKTLQKNGLITRDIETRKYHRNEISLEALFYNDVLGFMQQKVKIEYLSFPWLVVFDNESIDIDFEKALKNELSKQKNRIAFNKLVTSMQDVFVSLVLSRFREKERKIIETYRKLLLKYVKIIGKRDRKSLKDRYAIDLLVTGQEMKKAFPQISIPKTMVYIAAAKRFKQITKLQDVISQPYDLKGLSDRVEYMRQEDQCRSDLTEKETNELNEIWEYLTDHINKKIFTKYVKQINEEPKALIFYASFGFKGYLKKLKEISA